LTIFQSKVAELAKVGDELAASKKERSSLQAKVIQLTTALKSALATKVSLNLLLVVFCSSSQVKNYYFTMLNMVCSTVPYNEKFLQ